MKVLVHLYAPCCPVATGVVVEAETFAEARERALAVAGTADWEAHRPPGVEDIRVEGMEEYPQA